MIVTLLKVATPFTAVAVTVADPVLNVPLLSVSVTVEESDAITCPEVFWIATLKVVSAVPAVPVVGRR